METASTRGDRPELRATLDRLQPGDTLVIYKPDRVARSMKELLVFLEDELHARGILLEILTSVCAGVHRPNGATIADQLDVAPGRQTRGESVTALSAHPGVGRSTLCRGTATRRRQLGPRSKLAGAASDPDIERPSTRVIVTLTASLVGLLG
ncbi:recombinase family protein [Plantactinospora sp. S1510]|uniref:Recombinase family protein n=1 Tax=Plantactinospora alkalitolerans TaxID=2789879 RepID=A0ABS0GYA1_9ACTN|nr:recombinase family protein [Plantactinospora alkalitolerans]MBF9131188.1 recombinase family protein [Plantactinospora alkalitolerans]